MALIVAATGTIRSSVAKAGEQATVFLLDSAYGGSGGVAGSFGGVAVHPPERAAGTSWGVLVGWWMLDPMPPAFLILLVAIIAAARLYLKSATYTSYALVMTPLVIVLGSSDAHPSTVLLTERLIDILIGCLISLFVGSLPPGCGCTRTVQHWLDGEPCRGICRKFSVLQR